MNDVNSEGEFGVKNDLLNLLLIVLAVCVLIVLAVGGIRKYNKQTTNTAQVVWCDDETNVEYFKDGNKITSVRYRNDGFIKSCSK